MFLGAKDVYRSEKNQLQTVCYSSNFSKDLQSEISYFKYHLGLTLCPQRRKVAPAPGVHSQQEESNGTKNSLETPRDPLSVWIGDHHKEGSGALVLSMTLFNC